MIEPIGRIKNPSLRVFANAGIGFTVVTIISSFIIGVVKSEDKSVFKYGIYSSLFGATAGAVLGLVGGSKSSDTNTSQKLQDSHVQKDEKNHIWKDWRNFVVVRKVKESESIASFYLEPQDKGEIPDFKPGQFLTIKLDIPEQPKPVIRTYSLSDYNQSGKYYRLSIKRELAPPDLDVMPGIASNFMHDCIQSGSVILAKPPNGKFFLEVEKNLPAVLISNGVGITPMISMAKAVTYLNPQREIYFVHGARNGNYHALREEILTLAQENPHLNIHFRYSRPTAEDTGKYHSQGYVDTTLIQQLTSQEAEFFLCGSPGFMQSLRDGLQTWGVPEDRVFFESFSKPIPVASSAPTPVANTGEGVTTAEITFAKSGKTLTWNQEDGSILDFAENNGIEPPYSCRAGICGTCICQIREGEVSYQEEPSAPVDDDSVLICISQPRTAKIVLDI